MSYFLQEDSQNKNKARSKLDLLNYALKPNLKGATGIDTSNFCKML